MHYNFCVMVSEDSGWELEFYSDQRGRSPVEAFLRTLDRKMDEKVTRSLGLLRVSGPYLPMPLARPVTGERFWELRIQSGGNILRIFYFARVGRRIVLLHGFMKKDRKTPRSEMEVARRRYNEVVGGHRENVQ